MATFELSAKKQKNGRRPFVAGLYELQPPSCVVDDVGTKYNENGITFLEEYCEKQKDSIKDMSVTVEFIDDDRTQILGHGLTDVQDGMPIFENSTVVGHFTEGFIQDMEIDGETKRIMCGRGFLDEMRYPRFIANLEAELQNGNSVDGSIEIYKSEGNEGIVYKKGYLPKGRIPTEFIHSGWAMVLNPADSTSTLLELNSKTKKEEKVDMDEKELKALIESTIIETNSQNDDLNKQISELNTQISEKDNQITKYEEACNALNVKLKETKNGVLSLRDPMEVLRELSVEYNKLDESDIRRTNLLSSVGGKLRATQLDALLRQWTMYEKMLQEYEDGTGSMAREAEKTAKSWEGSLNRISNTWTSTVNNIANSDAIISGINFLNNLLQVVNKLTGALGSLGSIGLGSGIFAGIKNVGRGNSPLVVIERICRQYKVLHRVRL